MRKTFVIEPYLGIYHERIQVKTYLGSFLCCIVVGRDAEQGLKHAQRWGR